MSDNKEKVIRSKQVMLRFSDEEFPQVQQFNNSKTPLAVALRDNVLGLPLPEQIIKVSEPKQMKENRQHFAPIDPDFLRQVAGGMKNINRIATVINSNQNQLEKLHLVSQLANIEKQLNELLAIGYKLSNDH